MAFKKEMIDKYDVSYTAGGRVLGNMPCRAYITLRRPDNTVIGTACFYPNPATMPNNDTLDSLSGKISCNYPEADFPHVLDLLRNEKPVYIQYSTTSPIYSAIIVGMEPVGESE